MWYKPVDCATIKKLHIKTTYCAIPLSIAHYVKYFVMGNSWRISSKDPL